MDNAIIGLLIGFTPSTILLIIYVIYRFINRKDNKEQKELQEKRNAHLEDAKYELDGIIKDGQDILLRKIRDYVHLFEYGKYLRAPDNSFSISAVQIENELVVMLILLEDLKVLRHCIGI